MAYKIEATYTYSWDDAGWTVETDGVTKPERFVSVGDAQAALDEHFTKVRAAIVAGNWYTGEEDPNRYRIVESNN